MFYDNLKELCKNKGTTVTTMLKDLKFSSGSTGNWSRGALPNLEKSIAIAEYLGVSLDELVYGKLTNMSSSLVDDEWVDIITHIPEEKQQMCKDFLRTHMVYPEKYAERRNG